MAEHLSIAARKAIMYAAVTGAIGWLPVLAVAQSLSDPTRPPVGMASAAEAPSAEAASVPVLQSILVSPSRTQAIINGKVVKVGDTVGDAKVVRIAEEEVVLRAGKVSRVLKLYPDVDKKSATGRKDAKRGMQQP